MNAQQWTGWIDVTIREIGNVTFANLGSGNLASAVAFYIRHNGGTIIQNDTDYLVFDPSVDYLCNDSDVYSYQTEYQQLVNKIIKNSGK